MPKTRLNLRRTRNFLSLEINGLAVADDIVKEGNDQLKELEKIHKAPVAESFSEGRNLRQIKKYCRRD